MTSSEHTVPPKRAPSTRRSLKGRMMMASGWSLVQLVSVYGLRLASNLIMTRLLLPEAFGVLSVVMVLISAFTLFTDVGLVRSIIREPDGEETHFLRVAWVCKILHGGLISTGVLIGAALVWLLAPLYAAPGTVYADPSLPGLIAIAALVPLLQGLQSANLELTIRRLQNWRFTVVGIVNQCVGIASMILFAQISPTVWALLAGTLMINISAVTLSHLVYPGPRMGFVWDREIVLRLWTYGKFLMGSSALTFVARNADKLMLGGFLNATTFGLVTIAMVWVEAGMQLLGFIANRVGFPALAEVIRERPKEVPRLFRKFQSVIDAFCLTAFTGTFLLGEMLIAFLYTAQYAAAGGYLQILSLTFLVLRFETLNGLLMNIGDSRSMMHVSAIRALAICAGIPISFSLAGLTGSLFTIALAPMVSAPYTIYRLRGTLGTRQIRLDIAIYAAILLMATLIVALRLF